LIWTHQVLEKKFNLTVQAATINNCGNLHRPKVLNNICDIICNFGTSETY